MACRLCPQLGPCVPSQGPSAPLLFIVGQSPGEVEADHGAPFLGPSGALLDELLGMGKIPRSKCYITNAAKCAPPYNRPLTAQELLNCTHHLVAELKLIRPTALFLIGRDAYRLFSDRFPWNPGIIFAHPQMRERLLCSKHPAYFLRQGNPKGFLEIAPTLHRLVYEVDLPDGSLTNSNPSSPPDDDDAGRSHPEG
jgi:DNA polymerase